MRTNVGRLAVLLVALLYVTVPPVTPAHATTAGTVTFIGTVTTGPLGFPCVTVPANTIGITVTCPPLSSGPTHPFVFSSTTCLGEKVDVAKEKGTEAYGPACSMQASGTITGYCGLSTGTGTGTVAWFGGLPPLPVKATGFEFGWTEVGGTAVITGTAGEKGTLFGAAEIIENGTMGSCTHGTQTGLIMTGTLTLVDDNL